MKSTNTDTILVCYFSFEFEVIEVAMAIYPYFPMIKTR